MTSTSFMTVAGLKKCMPMKRSGRLVAAAMAVKKLNFEEAMARLSQIVEKLERGEESLENSMKLFEEGAKLSAQCYQILEKAQQKVTELTAVEEETE